MHLVFLNEVLKKKDQNYFEDLFSLIPNRERLIYHSDIDFTPEAGSVVVLDESDEWVFNDVQAFLKFVKKANCICLTATCAE